MLNWGKALVSGSLSDGCAVDRINYKPGEQGKHDAGGLTLNLMIQGRFKLASFGSQFTTALVNYNSYTTMGPGIHRENLKKSLIIMGNIEDCQYPQPYSSTIPMECV